MSDEYPQLNLEFQLCFRLYACSRAVTKGYHSLLAESGLTYPQYLTMMALWADAPLSVGEIGDRLHLDSGTLTPLLKRLEAMDIVIRRRDTSDERRVVVEPTPQGWRLRESLADVPGELVRMLGMPPEELAQLRDLLDTLLDHVEARTAPLNQRRLPIHAQSTEP